MTALTSDEVWGLCQDIYLAHGVRLSLPANTDRDRTYQWRYVTGLTDKFQTWGLDRDMARRFLEIGVQYAERRKLLRRKGLAVFFQGNLPDVCLKALQAEAEIGDSWLHGLDSSHRWIQSAGAMTRRESYGAYTNLVKWYRAGKVTELYLALSRAAGRAMRSLPDDERSQLPTDTRLYLVREKFLANPERRRRALAIMKEDMKNGSPACNAK